MAVADRIPAGNRSSPSMRRIRNPAPPDSALAPPDFALAPPDAD
jgi:hypothetical protein